MNSQFWEHKQTGYSISDKQYNELPELEKPNYERQIFEDDDDTLLDDAIGVVGDILSDTILGESSDEGFSGMEGGSGGGGGADDNW